MRWQMQELLPQARGLRRPRVLPPHRAPSWGAWRTARSVCSQRRWMPVQDRKPTRGDCVGGGLSVALIPSTYLARVNDSTGRRGVGGGAIHRIFEAAPCLRPL
jgi:hypothetical protein